MMMRVKMVGRWDRGGMEERVFEQDGWVDRV